MKKILFAFALALTVISSCEQEEGYGTGIRPDGPSYVPKDCVFQTRGLLNSIADAPDKYPSFTYKDYAPLADKEVKVFYYIPTDGDVTTMPVLFAFTGAEREGNTQLDAWQNFAQTYQFVVINPQFPKNSWSENEYQFGGVTDKKDSETLLGQELWTYNIVESLFDYWLKEVDGTQKGYRMFGHSAGAQFVSRMVMAMPQARIIKAVAANPSTWPWPAALEDGNNSYGWPYSIKNLPVGSDDNLLKEAFAKKLYVQLGTDDTGVESLDVSDAANVQGKRRFDRGQNFYAKCQSVAQEKGLECAYQIAEVEGVGHSTWHMVYGYYKPNSTKVDEASLGQNSAYLLLFK